MKCVKWLFVVLFFCSLTSFVVYDIPAGGLNIGERAPDFMIRSFTADGPESLSSLRGKYVLLSFWASYDATSRMQNVSLSHALNKSSRPVELVSVSFDDYASVFTETVKKDGIVASGCFMEPGGTSSAIYKKYRLSEGFDNYLLNENGVIVAKNVSARELESYLN